MRRDFDSVLVANRGEIACRILRTVRDAGLRGIAIYSQADRTSPHVSMVEDALCIGPGTATDSYLSSDRVIEAARQSRAGAIHPGYGFLSENADFAQAVIDAGIVWIGPSPASIRLMGQKAAAKGHVERVGVPCLPGYHGTDQSPETLRAEANAIGYPIMVKASAGGGGRGMRLALDETGLDSAIESARSEAERAFGSIDLILERALERPRHVEIQILADTTGKIVQLGERDCSVQRRHQKIIEEAPCPRMDGALRDAMGAAAIEVARSVDYTGAGTVEFLLAPDGSFYFLEMNTRLQVEHPVTEMVTGVDLVAEQLRIAAGLPLGFTGDDISVIGHAIEARLCAEDPANGFLPATGKLDAFRPPSGPGIRVDSGVCEGQEITPYYDPLMAKLIAWGPDRSTARRRLCGAIRNFVIFGPETNTAFLRGLLESEPFASGEATTGLVGELSVERATTAGPTSTELAIAAVIWSVVVRNRSRDAALNVPGILLNWSSGDPIWRDLAFSCDDQRYSVTLKAAPGEEYAVEVGGVRHEIVLEELAGEAASLMVDETNARLPIMMGEDFLWIGYEDRPLRFEFGDRRDGDIAGAIGDGTILAPMHGTVLSIDVAPGDSVDQGQRLAVVEAMKMQLPVRADRDGTVAAVRVDAGQQVSAGSVMVEILAGDNQDEAGG